jgi:hypothetical protein
LRRLGTVAFLVLVLGAVGIVGIVALELSHGPTMLALSGSHGLDTGTCSRSRSRLSRQPAARRRLAPGAGRRVAGPGPASAVLWGALLMRAGVVAKSRGPLVPAGGATLDGTISKT